MRIVRDEPVTGDTTRTRREEIVPLVTSTANAEPEVYLDCSQSEGWTWNSDDTKRTWDIQLDVLRGILEPFVGLDSAGQAGGKKLDGDDEPGVYTYPFSNVFLPIGKGDDDGDLNPGNFDSKMGAFMQHAFRGSRFPTFGGTEIMAAVNAGDGHYMDEFRSKAKADRPVRIRIVLTDGALNDANAFLRYLRAGTLDKATGFGQHGEWEEVWAIAILGEGQEAGGEGGGEAAYNAYKAIAADHPWVHPYFFPTVGNPAEIAEDMAVATVPGQSPAE